VNRKATVGVTATVNGKGTVGVTATVNGKGTAVAGNVTATEHCWEGQP
jgi:hypothetical protein